MDKAAFTYDHKPIRLDGKLELDIVFDDKAVQTPVYLKMNSTDQLLLSEGVCCLLGILTYHPSVQIQKRATAKAFLEEPPYISNSVERLKNTAIVENLLLFYRSGTEYEQPLKHM